MSASSWLQSVTLCLLALTLVGIQPTASRSSGLDECYNAYQKLAAKPQARAMAVTTFKNTCWWQWGAASRKQAEKEALASCRKTARDCRLLDAESDIAELKRREAGEREQQDVALRLAQTQLKKIGLYSGAIDGKRGPETISGIKKAQRKFDLTEDGKVNSSLLAKLKSAVLTDIELCVLVFDPRTNAFRDGTSSYHYYYEVRRRGISVEHCREKTSLPQSTYQDVNVRALDNGNLCELALSSSSKPEWSDNTQAVLEAHSRHLSLKDCREKAILSRKAELSSSTKQPTTTTQAPTAPTLLSLNDICRQSLNADGSDWSPEASAAQARSQAAALGVTVADCRTKLGLTSTIADMSAPAPAATTASLKKVALVIGNSAYRNAPELANPRNDADAIAAKLQGMDFDVVTGTDLDKRGTEAKIAEFVDKTAQADIALFFYAGHGIQVAGENYIVPVDATVEKPSAVDFELVNVSMVTNYLGGDGKVGIALLDACRNNPFTRSLSRALGNRGTAVGAGLAEVHANGGGLLVAFATAPGDVAADGDGMVDSPFTTALLRHLDTRGLEVELMMKRVKADVIAMTKNAQRPWTNSDLSREVYLAPGK